MDISCPICGEPWATDTLHEVAGVSYETARVRFATEGCALFAARHSDPPDIEAAAQSRILHDLLGDDVDGIASLMSE